MAFTGTVLVKGPTGNVVVLVTDGVPYVLGSTMSDEDRQYVMDIVRFGLLVDAFNVL